MPRPDSGSSRNMRWLWPGVALLVASLLGVAAHLADEVIEGERLSLDDAILLSMRVPGHLDTPIGPHWLLQSAIDISALGGFTLFWLFGALGLAFLLCISRRAEAAWFGASLVGASLLNAGLKVWVHRPRPELVPHLALVTNASFPSGHAMVSAAVYLTLAMMIGETQSSWRIRIFVLTTAVAIVLLVGLSRIYLGVHWPSDVLAGWCFGASWALLVWWANHHLRKRGRNRHCIGKIADEA